MDLRPITPHLGAEVVGVDLHDVEDGLRVTLPALFHEHRVLVFRDQQLDREQHKDLGRVFGELHVHPSKRHLDAKGDKEIFTVGANDDTVQVNGGRWHMDVSNTSSACPNWRVGLFWTCSSITSRAIPRCTAGSTGTPTPW